MNGCSILTRRRLTIEGDGSNIKRRKLDTIQRILQQRQQSDRHSSVSPAATPALIKPSASNGLPSRPTPDVIKAGACCPSSLPRRPGFISTISASDDPPATIYRPDPPVDSSDSRQIVEAINALFAEVEEGEGNLDRAEVPKELTDLEKEADASVGAGATLGGEEDELSEGEIFEGPSVRESIQADTRYRPSKAESSERVYLAEPPSSGNDKATACLPRPGHALPAKPAVCMPLKTVTPSKKKQKRRKKKKEPSPSDIIIKLASRHKGLKRKLSAVRSDEEQAQAERLAVSLMDDQTRSNYVAAMERSRALSALC